MVAAVVAGGALFWWSSRDQGVAAGHTVYVALGASDAVGVGADHPSTEGWVPLVTGGLPGRPDLINLGISGARLADVASQELPVAMDAQPDWISLWPGVNDLRDEVSLADFSTQLNALLDQLSRQTRARIILLNIPDLRALPAFASADPTSLDQTVRQWNSAIDAAARSHGAQVIDLYAHSQEITGHPEDVSSDGFHPSTAGYRLIADLVVKTVRTHDSPATP